MTAGALRRWHLVHRWTSLVCTLFLLVLCVTGLPLVFADELNDLGKPAAHVPVRDAPVPTLDALAARAQRLHPGYIVGSIGIDDDDPEIGVYLQPHDGAPPDDTRPITFDSRDGRFLSDEKSGEGVLATIAEIHESLFLGLPGELFLCVMGLLFVAAIVSGVLLYAPFARGRPFGDMRSTQSRRLRWLDLHNVLGIVLLGWMTVVGMTGVINTLSQPLFGIWMLSTSSDLKRLDTGDVVPGRRASLDIVLHAAEAASPAMRTTAIVLPSRSYGTPHHFVVWSVGRTHLTSRLFTVTLVDGITGRVTTIRNLPWYLRALEVSRPLHFGDYGGLPLKLLWALLDVAAIVVLASGVYLWLVRPRRERQAKVGTAHHPSIISVEAAE